MFHIT